MSDVEVVESLYSQIADLVELPFDSEEFESKDAYKEQVVRLFSNDSVWDDETYGGLPNEVQEWVNDATAVVKHNSSPEVVEGKKEAQTLPALDGLDEEVEEVAPKKRRGRKPKDPSEKKTRVPREKKARAPREKKERGPSRYLRAMRAMFKNPGMDYAALATASNLSEASARYCLEAHQAALIAFEEAGWKKS